ncbi:BBSome-interacting protein 1 [Tetrabaena socialis]|uniref:BBSome-interacting protein 1 n=1 Tax=Tetrabaena socialis TaxID=47790 RepID=A0A2J8AHG4_9CHLO|nr:BBSome-interacting protein 1 [Tetrabaena socialis]|eukprot:PNH11946.1 BBSome-interacting protein 1 [Tetrabaena socialis]
MNAQKPGGVKEVLPKAGLVVSEKGNLTEILCKPKLMPLKSITLQKLEEMESKIAEVSKQQTLQRLGSARPRT